MKYQILTPDGWSDFSDVRRLYRKQLLKINTKNQQLICTLDHKLKLFTNDFIKAQQLVIGDVLSQGEVVISIDKINNPNPVYVYDVMDVEKNNQYYTNGLVSHNCGNTFHRLWTQAEQGNNRFNTIKLPWYLHPQRDQAWRDAQTKQLGQKQAARQCDCLGENTKIKVQDFQGRIKTITIKELYQELNDE